MFIARILRRASSQYFKDAQKQEQNFVEFIASRTTDLERVAIEVILDKLEDAEEPHILFDSLSDLEKQTYEKFQQINADFEESMTKKSS